MTDANLTTYANQGVADWNYVMKTLSITSNMGFSFSRSTTISQCAVRFLGGYVPDVDWAGEARTFKFINNTI